MSENAPDDESLEEGGGPGAIAVGVYGRILKELDNMGVHLADDEYLDIKQFFQPIMRKIGGEGAVTHFHVRILRGNDVTVSRLGLQLNGLVKEGERAGSTA